MAEKDLRNLTKEELITLCEKQEEELKTARYMKELYYNEAEKLKSKLEIIANTIKL